MADYYSVLARALSGLPSKTGEARRDMYQRARLALQGLSAHDPPFPDAELAKEKSALEVAIRRVETEAASITSLGVGADHLLDSKVYIKAPAKAAPVPLIPTERASKLIQKKKTTSALAMASKWSVKVLASLAFVAGMAVLTALYIRGLVWASEHIIEYLLSAAVVATAVCLFILAPLAVFAKTRIAAAFGFLGASYIFAVTTWLLGFLTTLQYWRTIGVVIGLVLGIVGIVPIGMLASGLHTDWLSLGTLTSGLFLTYATRTLAMGLAAKC